MSPNPTERPVTIDIGGHQAELYFDIHTWRTFEKLTGKFFLDWLNDVQSALARARDAELAKLKATTEGVPYAGEESHLGLMRMTHMEDLLALIYAAWHEYDKNDEPHWKMSPGRIGRLITIRNYNPILKAIIMGSSQNISAEEEPKEDTVEEQVEARPTLVSVPAVRPNGGIPFGPSDEDILASRIENLDV